MRSVQILVLGGGASGLMAAITAAKAGGKVLLIEKKNRLGKKLLATGNGKCNFTNAYQDKSCYRSEDVDFVWDAIQQFPQEKVLKSFQEMGILPKQRDGYYYPASGQATSILDALIRQLKKYSISVQCEEEVLALEPMETKGKKGVSEAGKKQYLVTTTKGKYLAKKVIVAVGGKAAPVHGTTGDGYEFASSLGLSVIEPLPALTSCILKGDFMKDWTGVRVQGKVSLYGKKWGFLAEDQGELQMVGHGISGIPVFQVSRYAAKALSQGDKVYFLMDMMAEYTKEELEQELMRRKEQFKDWSSVEALDGMMHQKLAMVLLHSLGMDVKKTAGNWNPSDVRKMVQRMKEWKLGVLAVSDFDKAQVTCGGIATEEVDVHTMECKKYPGLYFTGEVLDVDGICGGYNLQWAWTSGYLAGTAAAEK